MKKDGDNEMDSAIRRPWPVSGKTQAASRRNGEILQIAKLVVDWKVSQRKYL